MYGQQKYTPLPSDNLVKMRWARYNEAINVNDNASAFCEAKYDEEIRKTLPYYEDFYKQVVDIVKIQFNRPLAWLDIGCGTGKMAEAALEAVDIDRLVFCDSAEKMLEIAKKRFAGGKTRFVLSDRKSVV